MFSTLFFLGAEMCCEFRFFRVGGMGVVVFPRYSRITVGEISYSTNRTLRTIGLSRVFWCFLWHRVEEVAEIR